MEISNKTNYNELIKAVSEFICLTELDTLNDNLNSMFSGAIISKEPNYTKETLSDMNFDINNILNLAIRLKELKEFVINEDTRIFHESEKTKKIA